MFIWRASVHWSPLYIYIYILQARLPLSVPCSSQQSSIPQAPHRAGVTVQWPLCMSTAGLIDMVLRMANFTSARNPFLNIGQRESSIFIIVRSVYGTQTHRSGAAGPQDTANALPNGAYVTDSVQCQTSLGWARCSWPAPRVFRFQALGQTFDVQIRCRGDVSNRFPTPDWPETSLSSA